MDNNTIADKNQTKEYHLKQAKKYRQGMLLVTHAKVKADYLAKAEMHELLAHDLADTVEDTPPIPSPPTLEHPKEKSENISPFAKMLAYAMLHTVEDVPPPLPVPEKEESEDIKLPFFVTVHRELALLILKKNANLIRAYGIWLILREIADDTKVPWLSLEKLVKKLRAKTGKAERTIKRWLAAGLGIFWYKGWKNGKRTVSLRGKDKVLDYFELLNPGGTQNVPVSKVITPKLKDLRASLGDVFFDKEKKWASRETIEGETGFSERTQRRYTRDQGIIVEKVFLYTVPWVDKKTGKEYTARQLPNVYPQRYGRKYQKHHKKRYDLRTVGYNGIKDIDLSVVAVKVSKQRVMHDNAVKAKEKVGRMEKQGKEGGVLAVTGRSRYGKIMVKAVYTSS